MSLWSEKTLTPSCTEHDVHLVNCGPIKIKLVYRNIYFGALEIHRFEPQRSGL